MFPLFNFHLRARSTRERLHNDAVAVAFLLSHLGEVPKSKDPAEIFHDPAYIRFDGIAMCDERAEHNLGRATRPMVSRGCELGEVTIMLYGMRRSINVAKNGV